MEVVRLRELDAHDRCEATTLKVEGVRTPVEKLLLGLIKPDGAACIRRPG